MTHGQSFDEQKKKNQFKFVNELGQVFFLTFKLILLLAQALQLNSNPLVLQSQLVEVACSLCQGCLLVGLFLLHSTQPHFCLQ